MWTDKFKQRVGELKEIMKSYITPSTFNKNESYIKENVLGDFVKWEAIGEDIVFTTNYVACPRIAFCIKDDNFIYDLGKDEIRTFVMRYWPYDYEQDVLEEPYSLFKTSVKQDYVIKHVNFIENWSKVIVHRDGSYEKVDYPLNPYSIELKDAYDNLYKLLTKYKKGVITLLEQNRFIPTLTGGVDTRCLSSLWRKEIHKYNINSFYLKDIKQDGKNRVDLGQEDLNCALQVAQRLGITNHINKLDWNVTLSGMYTEATRGMYKMDVNDSRFIYKFIQHQIRGSSIILPFADDLFLEIKQPGKDVFRCLLSLILCPDLLDLPYIGTQKMFELNNYKPYNFYEEYGDCLEQAKEIMNYWGEEKCHCLRNI